MLTSIGVRDPVRELPDPVRELPDLVPEPPFLWLMALAVFTMYACEWCAEPHVSFLLHHLSSARADYSGQRDLLTGAFLGVESRGETTHT